MEVETLDVVFQPRQLDSEVSESAAHVAELVRVLKSGQALDPITVIKVQGKWVCIDGHHRLMAYKVVAEEGRTGRGKPLTHIPVKVFEGTVEEAFDYSTKKNAKNRLNMSLDDKLTAAWRRVLLGTYTVDRIVEITTVSPRTVHTMRSTLRQARERHPDVKFEEWTWTDVRKMVRGEDVKDDGAWEEEEAKIISHQLAKLFLDRPLKHPRLLALGLLRYNTQTAKDTAGEILAAIRKDDGPADF